MPDQKTTDAALTALMPQYYEKKGLEALHPELRFYEFADKKPLPGNMGKTVNFYRLTSPAAVKTNMTELTVPTQVYLSSSRITATVIQRGAYTKFDTLVDMTTINPMMTDASEEMGRRAARTVDTYVHQTIGFCVYEGAARSALYKDNKASNATGTAAKIWSGGPNDSSFHIYHNKTVLTESSNVTAIAKTALTLKSIQHAVKVLRSNNAKPMSDGQFVGFIHPECEYQLWTSAAWKNWNKYTSVEYMYKGEVGSIAGVRFISTTDAPAYALSGDTMDTGSGTLYGTIIVGRGAYGVTEISGSGQNRGFRIYVKRSGDQTVSDPVSQVTTVGFKTTMAAKVLNKSAGVIILSTSVIA